MRAAWNHHVWEYLYASALAFPPPFSTSSSSCRRFSSSSSVSPCAGGKESEVTQARSATPCQITPSPYLSGSRRPFLTTCGMSRRERERSRAQYVIKSLSRVYVRDASCSVCVWVCVTRLPSSVAVRLSLSAFFPFADPHLSLDAYALLSICTRPRPPCALAPFHFPSLLSRQRRPPRAIFFFWSPRSSLFHLELREIRTPVPLT